MRIGLVTTVRNEQALLRRNLVYHHHLGVDVAYVYADDPADTTLETVRDLPFVCPRSTVPADKYRGHPAFADLAESYQYVPSRQVLNVFDAMGEARADELDWLFHLDPDELLCLDLEATRPGDLPARLSALPPGVEMVWFEPLEVVQTGSAYDNVFAEAVLFKRPIRGIARTVDNPVTGSPVSISSYYGHVAGKSGVKLSADARPANPHRFVRADGASLSAETVGHLLHYFAYDFDDFHKKLLHMKSQSDVLRGGAQRTPQKRLWKAIMNGPDMSREALEDYYRRWVVFPPDLLDRWRGHGKFLGIPFRRPALVEVHAVQRAWPHLEEPD